MLLDLGGLEADLLTSLSLFSKLAIVQRECTNSRRVLLLKGATEQAKLVRNFSIAFLKYFCSFLLFYQTSLLLANVSFPHSHLTRTEV